MMKAGFQTSTCSADLQSAVSPIFNRQGLAEFRRIRSSRRAAECNSAVQQIENLRYAKRRDILKPFGMSSRKSQWHWATRPRHHLEKAQ
jgi:hypothetical protein